MPRADSAVGSHQTAQSFTQLESETPQCQSQPSFPWHQLHGWAVFVRKRFLLIFSLSFLCFRLWCCLSLSCHTLLWRAWLRLFHAWPPVLGTLLGAPKQSLIMAEPAPVPQLLFAGQGLQPHLLSGFCSTWSYLLPCFLYWRPQTAGLRFVQMELNPVKDANDNKKDFYKYIGNKSKTSENVGWIRWGTQLHRTWKKFSCRMSSLPHSWLARLAFRNHRSQRQGQKSGARKVQPWWKRSKSGNA